jgi:excisionase family DNA binding protein
MQNKITICEAPAARENLARNVAPLAYGPKQAAQALGISRGSLYKILSQGKLPSITCGRRRLIRLCDLERFLSDTFANAAADAQQSETADV